MNPPDLIVKISADSTEFVAAAERATKALDAFREAWENMPPELKAALRDS